MNVGALARQHVQTRAASASAPPTQHDRLHVGATSAIVLNLRQAAVAAGAAAVVALGGAAPAAAKGTLLDLPSCTKFQQTPVGIAYCDVRQGSGDAPQLGDQVQVDYTARVAETGKVFDGSRGFEFTLGESEVVPGWELALLGGDGVPAIREGGIRTVRIPPSQAYGEDGYGCLYGLSTSCRVPPNSSVIINFEYKGLGY